MRSSTPPQSGHSKRESDQRPCQPVSRVLLLAWMNREPCSSSDTRCSELARGRSNRDDVKRRGSGCLDAASATIVANTARDCRCRSAPEPRLRASDRGPPARSSAGVGDRRRSQRTPARFHRLSTNRTSSRVTTSDKLHGRRFRRDSAGEREELLLDEVQLLLWRRQVLDSIFGGKCLLVIPPE